MTDLEITRLCAEAMGFNVQSLSNMLGAQCAAMGVLKHDFLFNPLHDDAQAMSLVKKFRLTIGPFDDEIFYASKSHVLAGINADNRDLNRAICECCAKMMLAKKGASDESKAEGQAR